MDRLIFEWDNEKNRINKKKHSISFEEAKSVFYDDNAIQFWDEDHSATFFLDKNGHSLILRRLICCVVENIVNNRLKMRACSSNEREDFVEGCPFLQLCSSQPISKTDFYCLAEALKCEYYSSFIATKNKNRSLESFQPEKPLNTKVNIIEGKTMKQEYDLDQMKSRPNPFAKQLKQQVTLPLRIDVIEYFETMAQKKGIYCQELINLYLQDCVTSKRELSFD